MTQSWMEGGSGWWRKAREGEGTEAGAGPGEGRIGREADPGAGQEQRGIDQGANQGAGAGLPRERGETDQDLTMRKVGPDLMIEKLEDPEVDQMRGKASPKIEPEVDPLKSRKRVDRPKRSTSPGADPMKGQKGPEADLTKGKTGPEANLMKGRKGPEADQRKGMIDPIVGRVAGSEK